MNHPVPKWLRVLAWCGVGIWATTICVLSSMTPPQLETLVPFQLWDKAEHFIAFAAGATNLTLALRWNKGWPWPRIIIFTAVALSIFGALDEVHQLFTPNRSGADPYDWSADTLGALAGTLLTSLIYARLTRARRPAPEGVGGA